MRQFTDDEVSSFISPNREHVIRLFDPDVDTMRKVVNGTATSGVNVSDRVQVGTRTETLQETVFQSVNLTMNDPDGLYHPDTGANKRLVKDRAILRVSVLDSNWTGGERNLFTGYVTGSPGYQEDRAKGGHKVTITAQDRMSRFQKRKLTSRAYALGTDYGDVVQDIAKDLMGLQSDEILVPRVLAGLVPVAGAGITAHDPVQFVDMPPAEMLAETLWPVFCIPKFDGDGRLTWAYWDINRSTDVIYDDSRLVGPPVHQHAPNLSLPSRIRIIGLDGEISQTVQPKQKLVEVEVTIGWWDEEYIRRIDFSEDGSQRAENAELVVIQSVTAGIVPIPGDEEFVQDDEFGGTLAVSTPYNQEIVILVALANITAAYYADVAPPLGGLTIPTGRIAQGAAQMLAQQTLMKIQRARYEIHAEPFEYLFREIEDVAELEAVPYAEMVDWERRTHLVTSHEWIEEILDRLVPYFIAQQSLRTITTKDWRLEAGDRFSIPVLGKHFVQAITESFGRLPGGPPTMTCLRVGDEVAA